MTIDINFKKLKKNISKKMFALIIIVLAIQIGIIIGNSDTFINNWTQFNDTYQYHKANVQELKAHMNETEVFRTDITMNNQYKQLDIRYRALENKYAILLDLVDL